jgi:hypothetical protein
MAGRLGDGRRPMPIIGDISKDKHQGKRIWCQCEVCGKERWVYLKRGGFASHKCRICACRETGRRYKGPLNPRWKGGKSITKQGYIMVRIPWSSPYFPMAISRNRVPEHRLVMAEHLGRCLSRLENVHHKNGVRNDNRLENLELISKADHACYRDFCSHCDLRKQIRLLRWQLKQQLEQIRILTQQLFLGSNRT